MRLIQFLDDKDRRRVGVITDDGKQVGVVKDVSSTRQIALCAIANGRSLEAEVESLGVGTAKGESYKAILAEHRILVPLDHEEDPAHCLVSGTGLTHLGSASLRDAMHQDHVPHEAMTDSMRVFRWGLDGGRPPPGSPGVQPEWFYKGDGSILVHPQRSIPVPAFAEDAGEEPELTGLYVIGQDQKPYRLGFAVGNEFSDHIMERRNYLYLAHSKLRYCSFGPELKVGTLPKSLSGFSRIFRDGELLWEKCFRTGEEHMSHTIENLEYHHFKYSQFLRPGDVHLHFFGSATASFSDGVATRDGDTFEISLPGFGESLRNTFGRVDTYLRPGASIQL
ncbi:MAG: hypothetical protein JWM42_648 [Burkholderia sp.]|nr:hypothetical protein [Burkholderia sp.]